MNERLSRWIADRAPAYFDGRTADLQTLRHASEENDLACIRDLAHKMKGTGTSYGFPEITDIGARMEAAARAGDQPEIDGAISALSVCLDGIKASRAGLVLRKSAPHQEVAK